MKRRNLRKLIYFYATCSEVAHWLSEWGKRFQLFGIFTVHPPLRFSHVHKWEDEDLELKLQDYNDVFLQCSPIQAEVKSPTEFWISNPDMLSISIPPILPNGLGVGLFGTGSKDRTAMRVWRQLADDFFAKTVGGMWAVYPSGREFSVALDSEVRYSPGIVEFQRQGGILHGVGAETWHVQKPTTLST